MGAYSWIRDHPPKTRYEQATLHNVNTPLHTLHLHKPLGTIQYMYVVHICDVSHVPNSGCCVSPLGCLPRTSHFPAEVQTSGLATCSQVPSSMCFLFFIVCCTHPPNLETCGTIFIRPLTHTVVSNRKGVAHACCHSHNRISHSGLHLIMQLGDPLNLMCAKWSGAMFRRPLVLEHSAPSPTCCSVPRNQHTRTDVFDMLG